MAKKPKPPRNKKYIPKKDQIDKEQIKQILRSKGVKGLHDHFKGYKPPKPRKLSMSWDLFAADHMLEMYYTFNPEMIGKPAPLVTLDDVYKGDLITCLREDLISPVQKFYIRIEARARNIETGEVLDEIFKFEHQFDPAIHYGTFIRGDKHSPVEKETLGEWAIYHIQDGEFKRRWKGIRDEWQDYLDSHHCDDFEIFQAVGYMECTTPFLSWAEERKFNALNLYKLAKKV